MLVQSSQYKFRTMNAALRLPHTCALVHLPACLRLQCWVLSCALVPPPAQQVQSVALNRCAHIRPRACFLVPLPARLRPAIDSTKPLY